MAANHAPMLLRQSVLFIHQARRNNKPNTGRETFTCAPMTLSSRMVKKINSALITVNNHGAFLMFPTCCLDPEIMNGKQRLIRNEAPDENSSHISCEVCCYG